MLKAITCRYNTPPSCTLFNIYVHRLCTRQKRWVKRNYGKRQSIEEIGWTEINYAYTRAEYILKRAVWLGVRMLNKKINLSSGLKIFVHKLNSLFLSLNYTYILNCL